MSPGDPAISLNRNPNTVDPDGFYEQLINAQRNLPDDKAKLFLANHVGDRAVLREAMTLARKNLD